MSSTPSVSEDRSGLLALMWLDNPNVEEEDEDVEDLRDGFVYRLSSEWLMLLLPPQRKRELL